MKQSPETVLPPEQIINQLIDTIFDEIERNYGPNGKEPKFYHNREHSENDVLDAATKIALKLIETGLLPIEKLKLIRLGAAGHDRVQGKEKGINEQESARLTAEDMRQTGIFSDNEIQEERLIICGTVLMFKDGHVTQMAGDNKSAQVVADADLASLGMPTEIFWQKALNLARENLGKSELNAQELQDFIRHEISFLEGHSFNTEVAVKLFPHKQANIEWLKTQVKV